MKAAQIVAPRRVEIVDVEEPRLNGDPRGMIKVRVDRACLCGSDMPLFVQDLSALQELGARGQRSNVPLLAFDGDFPFSDFIRLNLTLIGSIGPDVVPDYSLARDMIVQGRIDVSPLVTHVLPFQEVQQAYELFADRKDRAVKVVLDYETLR